MRGWLAIAGLAAALAGAQEPLLAPDDQVVFLRQGQLWAVRGDGAGLLQVSRDSSRRPLRPVAAPDGSGIAYEIYESGSGRPRFDIWTCRADGSSAALVLGNAQSPAWSPDAGRLLFAAQRGPSLDIWLATRAGTDIYRITDTQDPEYLPCWSPRGDRVAFVREVNEGARKRYLLVVRDPLGQEVEVANLPDRRISTLTWAPGENLLFTARGTGNDTIERLHEVDLAAGKQRELSDGPDAEMMGVWGYGAAGWVYAHRRGERTRILQRLAGAAPQAVAGTTDNDSWPTVLPGPSHRAVELYVKGLRSYYLPAPKLSGDDLLVPFTELGKQLGAETKVVEDKTVLTLGAATLAVDPQAATATLGTATAPLLPAPEVLGGVLMVPIRAVATLLGLHSDWHPETRVLRIEG